MLKRRLVLFTERALELAERALERTFYVPKVEYTTSSEKGLLNALLKL